MTLEHYRSNGYSQYGQGAYSDSNMYGRNPHAPQEEYMYRQLTIEEAIRIAQAQVPGQVVKAEIDRKGNRLIYEVEIVTNQGVKYEVEIDANSGAVLSVELD